MTKTECAIVTAYTGFLMVKDDDLKYLYGYVNRILGREVLPSEYSDKRLFAKIRRASKEDFKRLCEEASDE